jgi:AraC-like DNA-binding protein
MEQLRKHERRRLDDGRHLTVETHNVVGEHPLHWHSYFEIEIVLGGRGKYIVNDIEYDLSERNVFFLTSTDFHYLIIEEETVLINLSFDETMVSDNDLGALLFHKTEKAYTMGREEYERLVNVSEVLRHECETEGDCQKQLLQYILKCILRKNERKSPDTVKYEHKRGIKKAIVFMEMYFKERLTLPMIAAEAGYNPTYFSELFKKVTGVTCVEMLTKLRLGYAKTLLANGFSVSDACFLSGFGSMTNFLDAFKKSCKIPPGEYRKLNFEK